MTTASIPISKHNYQFLNAKLNENGKNAYYSQQKSLVISIIYGVGVAFFMSASKLNSAFRLFLAVLSAQKLYDLSCERKVNLESTGNIDLTHCRDSLEYLLVVNILLTIRWVGTFFLRQTPMVVGFALFYGVFIYRYIQHIKQFDKEYHTYVSYQNSEV